MLTKAIKEQYQRKGTSLFAIRKYLEETYPMGSDYKRYLNSAMKKAVENKLVMKPSPARFRLTKKGQEILEPKKRKTAPKKKPSTSNKKTSTSNKKPSTSNKKSSTPKQQKTKKQKTSSSSSDGKKKKKVASTKDSPSSPKTTQVKEVPPFKWQYLDGDYHDYDFDASVLVEEAYQEYLKNPGMYDVRAVQSGHWKYQVDFVNNIQTNITHNAHTSRTIRRVPNV